MGEATEDQLYDTDYSDSEEDDSDNDDDASINANPTDKKTEKETSGKKILRLTAFTKKQLLARTSQQELKAKIKLDWTGSDELSAPEFEAVVHICSVLTPFIPTISAKNATILQLPIVLICNFLQNASGYSKFNRDICPSISPAQVHALDVDAAAMYEMMASSSVPQNFTMTDQHNVPISSAAWATANKTATFASFLNLEKIKDVCGNYGLDFDHRFMYKSDGSVALLGELKPHIQAATSWYIQRRKTKNASKRPEAKKTLTKEEEKSVDDSNAKIKELTNALLPVQKKLKFTIIEILELKAQRKPLAGGDERQNLYTTLKDKKSQRNELQSQVFGLKDKLKVIRANKYNTLYKMVLFVKMDSSNGDRY
jgi:hypothetical protein